MERFTGDLFTAPIYPDCDYRVINPSTWNPASFAYAELDSPASVAAIKYGTRILCESGPKLGIYIAKSSGSAELDGKFVRSNGLRINVISP